MVSQNKFYCPVKWPSTPFNNTVCQRNNRFYATNHNYFYTFVEIWHIIVWCYLSVHLTVIFLFCCPVHNSVINSTTFHIFYMHVHHEMAESHLQKIRSPTLLFTELFSFRGLLIFINLFCAGNNFVSLPRFIMFCMHVHLGVAECRVQISGPAAPFFYIGMLEYGNLVYKS